MNVVVLLLYYNCSKSLKFSRFYGIMRIIKQVIFYTIRMHKGGAYSVMNNGYIKIEERLKSRIKRRIKLATWYDIGCMILIALALFMLGDIAVSRMNGTFSYNSAGFVPYEEQIAQILEEKDNATYRRTTSKNIDYGKLEEKFLQSLEENGAHPVTKDLLMLGLKFYELSDARMRTIIDNGDKIGDVAVDFATQIQEDHENGIEMKDRASQFVEDVNEAISEDK